MPMLFQTFAETLEALEPVTGRLQMIAMLADTLRQADARGAPTARASAPGDTTGAQLLRLDPAHRRAGLRTAQRGQRQH